MKTICAGVAAAFMLAGCASTPTSAAACLAVPNERAASILGSKSGLTVDKSGAIKSAEHKNAYYLAIRFSGPGISKEVGVWAVTSLESGPAYSVDAFAEQFSGLPKMAGFSVTDSGASAAKSCV